MTMLEQRIQQHFFESADLKYQSAEVLSRPVADAAQAIVAGLTAGGRLFTAGAGVAASLAQLVANELLGRFERERPGLAAMALGQDGSSLATLARLGAPETVLVRQLEPLGQPGDLLLLIDPEGDDAALRALAQSAQSKDMTVIALTGQARGQLGGALATQLGETDVLVAVPHERRARVLEALLLVLHCLCDAIDLQLLGEQDPA